MLLFKVFLLLIFFLSANAPKSPKNGRVCKHTKRIFMQNLQLPFSQVSEKRCTVKITKTLGPFLKYHLQMVLFF